MFDAYTESEGYVAKQRERLLSNIQFPLLLDILPPKTQNPIRDVLLLQRQQSQRPHPCKLTQTSRLPKNSCLLVSLVDSTPDLVVFFPCHAISLHSISAA